jgi:hypothetical protein
MTFGTAIQQALNTGSDPAVWVTMHLEQYRTCTDTCRHDLAQGILVTDLLNKDPEEPEWVDQPN